MRNFGLLLHISSLPSAYGIGDLGPAAFAFADLLARIRASVWQILPLHPTSTFIGNSPYSSPSAFAGNPLFISPELLLEQGRVSRADLETALNCIENRVLSGDPSRVDFTAVEAHRGHLLTAAFERAAPDLADDADFRDFCRNHDYWLHDFARFATIKRAHSEAPWFEWPGRLRLRAPDALAEWDEKACRPMLREKFIQYLFYSQWQGLRSYCAERGILLLGDAPIYVTHDSADCWANPHYFNLDAELRPITVSGVPPDYFSATGQRWGTPIYRWDVMRGDGFDWWKKRLGHALTLVDRIRLDHFRGFCAYWEVPEKEKTAVNGQWRKAPAADFLEALRAHFGSLPILAEDLGVITPEVREVMSRFDLPGMHVLQFAFGGEIGENSNIPHNHNKRSCVYTGTHDNAPTRAWFSAISPEERENFLLYSGAATDAEGATRALARLAFSSVGECCILPAQDALNLGEEARMNTPGLARGNWSWRLTPGQAAPDAWAWLADLARLYGRQGEKAQPGDSGGNTPMGSD
ncbi:MAG: 4-alpha-glucanotransferase [Desulfovibrio sp.]|jgi:4-alpha-glucanotransferase|nr:4-alpha-glucanotransferase [Desulfovibrio sp.]